MTTINQTQTPAISSAAMLVNLNLSVWTGRKMDKKVSAEIDGAKNTRAKAGSYHKSLLAGTDKLEKIKSCAGQIRLWHYATTTPWSDGGARLLPTALFMQYKTELAAHQAQLDALVSDFLSDYSTLISAAAFTLGDLFNRDEYPDVDSIRDKFAFAVTFSPVPESGDFRIDVGNQQLAELQVQYQAHYDASISNAMRDVWQRLYDAVYNLSDRLSTDEAGKNKIFRDSLLSNATDLCKVLQALNVTGDAKLEAMRAQLAATLDGVEAQDLRDDAYLRANVKATVDDMLDKFNF